MYIDSYYLILVVPALLLSIWAQVKVKSTFDRFSKEPLARRMTGAQAARLLLERNNITDVRVERVAGHLTDHYDPASKVLRLSESVYTQDSLAAVGVAAHEAGHAIQHATRYGPLVLRSVLVPVANIGSGLGPTLALVGLVMSLDILMDIGLLLFAGAVLFYLVTLPVEFNASSRALSILGSSGIISREELGGVRQVLNAAAMTYVASALSAIGNFVRLLLLSRNSRR